MSRPLILAIAALALLSQSADYGRRDAAAPQPMLLALELGRLGEETGPSPSQLERRGTSERVFGPVHPRSRLGTYTGSGTGAYRGNGTGSYTGGGLGRIETFGMQPPPPNVHRNPR